MPPTVCQAIRLKDVLDSMRKTTDDKQNRIIAGYRMIIGNSRTAIGHTISHDLMPLWDRTDKSIVGIVKQSANSNKVQFYCEFIGHDEKSTSTGERQQGHKATNGSIHCGLPTAKKPWRQIRTTRGVRFVASSYICWRRSALQNTKNATNRTRAKSRS